MIDPSNEKQVVDENTVMMLKIHDMPPMVDESGKAIQLPLSDLGNQLGIAAKTEGQTFDHLEKRKLIADIKQEMRPVITEMCDKSIRLSTRNNKRNKYMYMHI